MKVRLHSAQDGMLILESVEHPGNSVVFSLPPEFDQELFLARANMAFDTLAQGLNRLSSDE